MPAEGRENPLLKKGNSDAFFREKYLTKNKNNISCLKRLASNFLFCFNVPFMVIIIKVVWYKKS